MEFSEAFRAEDISKTDFFDFVVTPEDMGNDIVLHNNFPAWSRKSMGLFANNNNTENHNNNVEEQHVNGPAEGPDLHPTKETNNNILSNFGDDSFWDTGGAKTTFAAAAASVNIKMESPTLEDINEICWSSNAEPGEQASDQRHQEKDGEGQGDGNTDGSIYTLTVVNGQDGPQNPGAPGPPGPAGPDAPPLWYRPPDLSSILREGDEQLRQAMSAMDSQYQTPLDIDSIISILPSLPSMADSLGHGLFGGAPLASDHQPHHHHHHGDDLLAGAATTTTTATCDDSGFVESKEEASSSQTERRGSYSENNNDWAFSNHNDGDHSSAESLLRSALQGGKSYLNQYNGPHLQADAKTLTELGPPGGSGPDHSSLGLFMGGDGMLPMDGGGSVLLFDDSAGSGGVYGNGSASSQCTSTCTSTTCMDDILMSPLDDYDKLRMIENEVAESAKRYGVPHPHQVNGLGPGSGHAASHYGAVPPPGPPALPPGGASGGPTANAVPHSSTPPSKPKKKSSKRSGDRPPAKPKTASSTSSSVSSSGGLGSTSGGSSGANGGVRRERSLHHCTICSKAFKDKYSVNVHIRTHTGEKPFACSVCGKSFRQKAHLAKHYHTHVVQKSEHLGPTKSLSTKAR